MEAIMVKVRMKVRIRMRMKMRLMGAWYFNSPLECALKTKTEAN